MGESKRRKQEIDALKNANTLWAAGLAHDEVVIKEVALKAHKAIVEAFSYTGGCYLLSFFLHVYLLDSKGIQTDLKVGYVNDGTGPIMISHGWIEYLGKKTDISLTLTEHPDVQLTGGLLILDHIWQKGRASYSYHPDRTSEAITAVQNLIENLDDPILVSQIKHKEEEHIHMLARTKDIDLVRAYFSGAPKGLKYADLVSYVEA